MPPSFVANLSDLTIKLDPYKYLIWANHLQDEVNNLPYGLTVGVQAIIRIYLNILYPKIHLFIFNTVAFLEEHLGLSTYASSQTP